MSLPKIGYFTYLGLYDLAKHKLTDKIRVLEHVEQISLNKKRLLVEIKKTLKDINRKNVS